MKLYYIIVLIFTSFVSVSYAEEIPTECIQMKEQNQRVNPKENLISVKANIKNIRPSVSGQ